MNICMVGTGYVGLVTGACLSDFGMDVTCVDKDEAKIALLKRGVSPIYEPGLEELIHKNEKAGRLRFSTDIVEAIDSATWKMKDRSGEPSSFGGVPTAMKMTSERSIASTMSVEKRRRPAFSFLWMSSSRPGS